MKVFPESGLSSSVRAAVVIINVSKFGPPNAQEVTFFTGSG